MNYSESYYHATENCFRDIFLVIFMKKTSENIFCIWLSLGVYLSVHFSLATPKNVTLNNISIITDLKYH